MSQPFTYLVRDCHDNAGRTVSLLVEKTYSLNDSLSLFHSYFGEEGNIEVLNETEFFSRYCDFVPDPVKEIMKNCEASGFVWSSNLFFNYG